MVGKDTWKDYVFNFFNGLFFFLFGLICFFPFYYILINTISANDLVSKGKILFYPVGVHLTNYQHVFQLDGLFSAAAVSVLRTVIGTLVTVLCSSFLGYAISRAEFWHRKFWYRFIIVVMYFNAGLIPCYQNIKMLGLLNNFWVYVIPSAVAPFYVVLVKTYVESIPSSLEESAIIDGAGYFRRFGSLILPLAKPIIATVTVFCAVDQWNCFMDTILYMTGNRYQTLQSILYQYLNQVNALAEQIRRSQSLANAATWKLLTPISIRYTVTVITVLPILLVYPFFQRFFTKGIMLGAVKG